MVKRRKVGIIYKNDENWIGGTYYIQNLVFALATLPDEHKPELTILCTTEKEFFEIKESGYPYLFWKKLVIEHLSLSIYKKVINKLQQFLKGKDKYPQQLKIESGESEIIFPAFTGITNKKVKKIFWIPDFQEQQLPHFFSSTEIKNRTQSHWFIAKSDQQVLFSSTDAYNTFEKLFPRSTISKYVLRFAVTHPVAYKALDIELLKHKYKIDLPYFFAPNQLWKHKNQIVILKAVKNLREKGIEDFIIAFSGKEHDYRNPDYVTNLKKFVVEHKLENNIKFLGFIDREEQLKLMSEAIAIIQPSLFEGWSTVVEDAKAMNQWVIASDLPVHREQLNENVSFFMPDDEIFLASNIREGIEKGFDKGKIEYNENVKTFAEDFINIISKC